MNIYVVDWLQMMTLEYMGPSVVTEVNQEFARGFNILYLRDGQLKWWGINLPGTCQLQGELLQIHPARRSSTVEGLASHYLHVARLVSVRNKAAGIPTHVQQETILSLWGVIYTEINIYSVGFVFIIY